MSNRWAKRVIPTIKQSIDRINNDVGSNWKEWVRKAVFGYRRRTMKHGHSPSYLFYVFKPRLASSDEIDMIRTRSGDASVVQ